MSYDSGSWLFQNTFGVLFEFIVLGGVVLIGLWWIWSECHEKSKKS